MKVNIVNIISISNSPAIQATTLLIIVSFFDQNDEIKTFDNYPDITKPRRLKKYIWCSRGMISVVVDEKELQLKLTM